MTMREELEAKAGDVAAVYVGRDELVPWAKNPRKWSRKALERLAASLKRFGIGRPIVAQEGSNMILAGNRTWHAAGLAGLNVVPVRFVKLDDREARLYALADNKLGEESEWDDELLEEQIVALLEAEDRELEETLADLDLAGFTQEELERLDGDEVEVADPKAARERKEKAIPEPTDPPEEPDSQLGQVYELGPHRLICGDSTDPEILERLLGPGQRADAVVTDPPYAIYGSSSGITSSVTDDTLTRPFFRALLAAAQRGTKLFAQIYVCCDWRSWPSIWEAARGLRLEPKNLLVWDKSGSGLGNNWANTYELIGYFAHMPEQKAMKSTKITGQRPVHKPNILRFARPTGDKRPHNASKPEGLIAEIIEAATDPGEVVLDLCTGGGTTLFACSLTERQARLVELSPAWCDVIRKRWTKFCDELGQDPGPGALR